MFPGSCIAIVDSVVLVMDIAGLHQTLKTLRYGPLSENLYRIIYLKMLSCFDGSMLNCDFCQNILVNIDISKIFMILLCCCSQNEENADDWQRKGN